MDGVAEVARKPQALELRDLTLRAFEVAKAAAAGCERALHDRAAAAAVQDAEKQLDQLDRQVDERLAEAIAGDPVAEARELLACAKFMVDLERIGDLAATFCNILSSTRASLSKTDTEELTGMASTLEQMLGEIHNAYLQRSMEAAVRVLRADSEIDRLRNLIFMRHIENPEGQPGKGTIQTVFMAQALERAGDHAKNVAEEVCHLVSGHSLRHVMRVQQKPDEVAFIENIRKRMKAPPKKKK
jgi:phosphate transport system protein